MGGGEEGALEQGAEEEGPAGEKTGHQHTAQSTQHTAHGTQHTAHSTLEMDAPTGHHSLRRALMTPKGSTLLQSLLQK